MVACLSFCAGRCRASLGSHLCSRVQSCMVVSCWRLKINILISREGAVMSRSSTFKIWYPLQTEKELGCEEEGKEALIHRENMPKFSVLV